jgi:hypothetical protein
MVKKAEQKILVEAKMTFSIAQISILFILLVYFKQFKDDFLI